MPAVQQVPTRICLAARLLLPKFAGTQQHRPLEPWPWLPTPRRSPQTSVMTLGFSQG